MEDVLEELLEAAESVPVPLDQPTDEQIVDAQEQIFLPLPAEYRQFLIHASHLVVGRLEPATVADPISHVYLPEMCASAWDQGVPRHLLAICGHPNGYYCMDPDGCVLNYFDGELNDDQWDSIWQWARDVWLTS